MSIESLRRRALRIAAAAPLVAFAAAVLAADPPSTVLVRRGDAVITRADWDAQMQGIPAKDRADFAANPRRIRQLLDRLLQTRDLALKAKAEGLAPDPAVLAQPGMDEERALAAAMVASVEQAAARDFDARTAAFERRARELYTVNPQAFAAPEKVTITFAYFASAKDGADGAAARATDTLAKAKAGADLGELAATLSDDATTREARGRRGPIAPAELDRDLAAAVALLRNPGQLADVVRIREGFAVVRLDARIPGGPRTFDEAKSDIMQALRQKQVDDAREALFASLATNREIVVNSEAIDALRTRPK